MNYLVTGGTGLAGSRIVRDLVSLGQSVVVYDWHPNKSYLKSVIREKEIDKMVKIVKGDVTDLPLLLRTIKTFTVEKIIHTASLLTLETNSDPILGLKVNCEGTLSVFEAAKILGVKKVVFASSNSVFGPPTKYSAQYIANDAAHLPQNIYAATKSFNEIAANYYFDQHNVDITGVRYMHVYGLGQTRGIFATIVKELVLNPALGKPGIVPYGDAVIGWSYVDDPARATVMASMVPFTKTRTFSIVGDIYPITDVANYIRDILPDANISLMPGEFTGDPINLDTNPIENEIGYHSKWTMQKGMKETINLVRKEQRLNPI